MARYRSVVILWLWFVSFSVWAKRPVDELSDYIRQTYGQQLVLEPVQLEQLAWVLENPVATPEMSSRQKVSQKMHPEVPRALDRLYCLHLLKQGNESAYHAFIQPQKGGQAFGIKGASSRSILTKAAFMQLAALIGAMNEVSYKVLENTAIISAVSLSPQAKKRAAKVLKGPLPVDSVQFLSATAPYAKDIYPLARDMVRRYPSAKEKIEIVFLKDSHLRHMMYNEGALSMYQMLGNKITDGSLPLSSLDLWYAYWVVNIAGFRGHIDPMGSLYLDQNTFMAMNTLRQLLGRLYVDPKLNPMTAYLQVRARWLKLNKLTKNSREQIALASLGSLIRLFTPQQGKALFTAFRQLSQKDQARWMDYVSENQKEQDFVSPTYLPAVFVNAIVISGFDPAVQRVMPVVLNALSEAQQLRYNKSLDKQVPLSFRVLAETASVNRILQSYAPIPVTINRKDGVVTLQ